MARRESLDGWSKGGVTAALLRGRWSSRFSASDARAGLSSRPKMGVVNVSANFGTETK